jgi:hypothetical protein
VDVGKAETEKSEVRSQELEALHRYEDRRSTLKRPEPQFIPQPIPQPTNPVKAWGSAAMVLAALASLKTRRPMVAAFNAAGKVLEAYRRGDQATADAAFQSWKIASQNAKETFEYENKVYEDILGDISHREDLTTKEADKRVQDITATLTARAHDFQDQMMVDRLTVGGIQAAQRLVIERAGLQVRGAEAAGKIEEAKAESDLIARRRYDADAADEHRREDQRHTGGEAAFGCGVRLLQDRGAGAAVGRDH